MMKRYFATLLALWCWASASVWALDANPAATPAAEVLAKDMREEVVRIQVTVKDMYGREATRPVPITIYRPAGEGPFPLLVFNHGRSPGDKRAQQGRSQPETVARYLVAKGFVVMAPTRIGYWETYGDFDPENSACKNIEPMSIAASQQVLATVEFAKTLPYVDASRWLVAGQSVGGLTAVATVGRAPMGLLGGINFSGGTGGNPDLSPANPCNPAATTRYWGDIAKNAKVPMLWMYWENDKYWGPSIPKTWHRAWVEGGGHAQFAALGPSGDNGHSGVGEDMDHWLPVVDRFLRELGFDRPAIVTAPPPSGFADVSDLNRVPVSSAGKAAYAKFLEMASPKAFAITTRGGFGFARGDYAPGRAMGFCQRSNGNTCVLYAVNDDVVWKP
jgi:dienelactone hydrolase